MLNLNYFVEGISMSSVEERLSCIETEIKHIGPSLDKIWEKLDEMCPKVIENNWWIQAIKRSILALSVSGVLGGIITTAYYLVRSNQ